jgi:hypothetical protein
MREKRANMRTAVGLLLATCLVQPALAQTSETPIVSWLEKNEVAIRKTFDGKSKEEGEPARVSYNNPNTGRAFFLVDLAMKFSEWDVCANCIGKSVILYPVLEWHRSTSEFEEADKFKVGPSADLLFGDLTKQLLAALFVVKGNYERDAVKDTNSANASVLFGLMGGNKAGGGNTWLPMSHVNDGNGDLLLRYAPYIGVEYYDNLVIEKKNLPTIPAISLTAVAAHLQVDLYPFNRPTNPGWFEITTSYAYRRRTGGGDELGRHLALFSSSVNIYFDTPRHFALGYDYESGRSPKNNFDKQHSSSVGFKVKF